MRKFTLNDFNVKFPDDATCLGFLFHARWPNGVFCETCQRVTKHFRIRSKKVYGCAFCGHEMSPTAGTIYDHSSTPLRSWFYAIFLMAQTRTGVSAKQLQRELGVTYKTAWRIFSKVRELMAQSTEQSLFGAIEVDETYIGGKRPGKPGRGAANKTIVFGMVERGGKAYTQVTPDVRAKTLLPIIQEHIPTVPGTIIYTDELRSYGRLGKLGYAHETIQHAAKQYVNGAAHVNNVESLWSNIKRGLDGVNHSVSPQHLQSYLDSYVFRYNHRDDDTPLFLTLINRWGPCE
ncbi:MAG: IS1595 family transposase [Chloroflexi bacterium]|nr:IS1595 family transposase [Chloroflexota bacterium]